MSDPMSEWDDVTPDSNTRLEQEVESLKQRVRELEACDNEPCDWCIACLQRTVTAGSAVIGKFREALEKSERRVRELEQLRMAEQRMWKMLPWKTNDEL